MQQATVPGLPQSSVLTKSFHWRRCGMSSPRQSRSLAAERFLRQYSSPSSRLTGLPSQQTWHRRAVRRLPPAAALSGDSMQDFIVGSSLATAIGAAIFYGTKVPIAALSA